MLKNANYIYDNVIKADEVHTTKKFCKKAQVGVDLSVKDVLEFKTAGTVCKSKTYASATTSIEPTFHYDPITQQSYEAWILSPGTYIIELNEGCSFGPNDTGFIILRSSLNRCGVSIESAVWDPGYTSVEGDEINPMSVRMTVHNPYGFELEKNARVAQLIVVDNQDTEVYNGQWQGGRTTSKLV